MIMLPYAGIIAKAEWNERPWGCIKTKSSFCSFTFAKRMPPTAGSRRSTGAITFSTPDPTTGQERHQLAITTEKAQVSDMVLEGCLLSQGLDTGIEVER